MGFMGSLTFIVIQLIHKEKCLYSYNTKAITTQVCVSALGLNTACSKRNERCSSLQQNPHANLTYYELHYPLASGVGG
jgi:hypothetical protein